METNSYSTSVGWLWFGYFQTDVEQNKTMCNVRQRLVASKNGNTTNLYNHLERYHSRDYEESMKIQAGYKFHLLYFAVLCTF